MRISTIGIFDKSTETLVNQQKALADLQEKIASGKRILSPTDDPTGATNILNLRKDVNSIEQFIKNTEAGSRALEFEDVSLGTVSKLYQRIKELTISAGNGSLSMPDIHAIADEVQERLNELLDISNSRNADGDYIFSGYLNKTKTVTKNSSGEFIYNGDEGERQLQLGESTLVQLVDNGKKLFFDLDTSHFEFESSQGVTNVAGAPSALVNVGSLPSLDTLDLKINNINITPPLGDGVSNVDASQSAIAMANAINSQYNEHGVKAIVDATTLDLGIPTAGIINSGELLINGIEVIDAIGAESSILENINSISSETGVVASQPGGAGTAFILTAADGRNINVQTSGVSVASFANFDLTSGALDQVKRGSISLRDHTGIDIQGSNPQDYGFTRGQVSLSTNTGTGVLSNISIVAEPENPNETYSIVFNSPATTYSVYADSNPGTAIVGFENVTYTAGEEIEFNGIRATISGVPAANDTFGITLDSPASQDVFTTMQRFVDNIKLSVGDPTKMTYEIDLMLKNLDKAEGRIIEVRSQVGARMNIVDSQKDYNESRKLLIQEGLSLIEDLDYTEAISQISQLSFALQAVQQTFVRIQSLSLFNYL